MTCSAFRLIPNGVPTGNGSGYCRTSVRWRGVWCWMWAVAAATICGVCVGAGAEAVIGIDPTLLFLSQFQLVKRYAGEYPVWMLPLKSEDLPDLRQKGFDTVFSMGVLYHRRDPLGHLQELRRALRAGGELVLETLVVEGDEHTALMPHDRYAKMRNVWFIPSVPMLELWLKRLGFTHIRVVDVTPTSMDEQRCTGWSKGESLADFLDP